MDSDSAAPIVGREKELGALARALDALGDGDAGCVSVEGEPGIGKTRLLTELRGRAEARGQLVLTGAASEFERELPFSVFADALDGYVAEHGLGRRNGWDAELERELGAILPSLHGAQDVVGIADERFRTHRAVRRLLGLIAAERPLVLVLDDLHWSDSASIELIAALVRRRPAAPVLLALGFRSGAAAMRLSAALAGAPVTRLELAQLSRAEAAALLDGAEADVVAAIYGHAGGNPFYLQQLGRAGGATDLARSTAGAIAAGVPPAVAAVIAGELESLSPQSRTFLDAAAVAGEPFEPDLASAIAGLSDLDGLAALDDLLAHDLVRPTDVPRRFGFRHPLVRSAVYESTRGGWRLAAHARAAAALAARGACAAERAHHVEQSAARGDEAAIALLLDAGHAAAGRAPAAAARWFEAALRLLPSDDAERQIGVRVELASAQRSLGELERCRATLLAATELVPPEAAMRRLELTALCAAVEHWQGRHEDAHRRLIRAWEELRDRSTPEAAALQVELAVDGLYKNDFEQTLTLGEGALATARALEDRGLVAVAAAALALGEAAAARVEPAREHRGEALAQIEVMEEHEVAVRLETLYYLGWAESYLEHYDDAIARAERGVAIARATGEGRLLVPLMLLRCYPLEMQGRLAEANELCETAVEIARLSANPHYLFWALWELAWARYFAGDLDGTLEAGEESVRVGGGRTRGGTMPSAGGGAGWALALAHFELGEAENALKLMGEVGGEEMENWYPVERFFNWENVAVAELALGNDEAADSIARGAEQSAAQIDLRLPTALAARTRAAVQLAGGDPLGAARAAEDSVAAAAAIGATLQVAYSLTTLGRALAAAGDRNAAVRALREAERTLDACGSVRMREEARRELRRLGARIEVRGPAAGDSGVESLSKREREICELITDRMTNKEIAAQLFLSAKTIESHVRNIFVKLGVSSRVDVARVIERQRREPVG